MKTSTMQIAWGAFAILALALAIYVALTPVRVAAVGTAADAMCAASRCVPGGNPKKDPPCPTVKCGDSTNGFATGGVCVNSVPGVCKATSAQGQNGGMGDIKQALDAVKSILDMMKGKGGGGGGGGGEQSGTNPLTNPTLGGCSQYYNVTTPSSDPCAVYVPPVSDSLTGSTTSAAGDLISSLLSGTYGNPTTINTNPSTNAGTNNQPTSTAITTGTAVVNQASTTTRATFQTTLIAPAPGVSGDIQYSASDVTVLVNNIDTKNGTQVAGFYGTGAGGQPTGVISNMCQGRPWASNFLSSIIPSAFFDSLCELRGYKVGSAGSSAGVVNAKAPTASAQKPAAPASSPKATTTPAKATSTEPYVEPKVDIWAVPASVPLGARTTVFWNAKGVTSCTATSPDGSFSQNTLSGGAATVPLSGPTTYTISCLTPAGTHVTNYVTVTLGTN